MGKAKSKSAKFAAVKKIISKKTIKKYKEEVLDPRKKDAEVEKLGRNVLQVSSALFFSYNMALGPPYRVIVDTNFINFSIQNKLDLDKGMMDCLYAKCAPCITDCVMAEHEKLGQKYRVALRIAKDPRFRKLACTQKGTYADDCIVDTITRSFTWIWEYLLMEFVNSFVRRRTVDIEAAMRNAKIDYEIRIHQLEHKLDLASSYLAALTSRLEVSADEARSSASLIKARETSITRMRLVMIGCLPVWFFSVGMKEPMAG